MNEALQAFQEKMARRTEALDAIIGASRRVIIMYEECQGPDALADSMARLKAALVSWDATRPKRLSQTQEPSMDNDHTTDRLRIQYELRDDSTCQRHGHDLFKAAFCSTSQAGDMVYLLCFCGQQRRITRVDWEEVEAKRATWMATHIARETREEGA